ncbi:MAG: exopolyphosphatase [Thermodesulfobacteriota bacterium]
MRIASLDIGTNTFRILICESKGKQLRTLYINRVITRLGGGFTKGGKIITEEAIERSIRVLKEFSRNLEKYKVERVRAIATSVVRESLNGDEFIKRAKDETGMAIEVISGDEEARLTVEGALQSISIDTGYKVIFDIGGGSTEYSFIDNNEIIEIVSTQLGVVHLTEKYLHNDIPSDSSIKKLTKHIENTITSRLLTKIKYKDEKLSLIATAGTPTTLAAIEMDLEKYNADLVNGFILKKEMLTRIFEKLISIPMNQRLKVKGLEKGREDVIIPGILIMLKTMERFLKDEVVVSDGGILEGTVSSIIT